MTNTDDQISRIESSTVYDSAGDKVGRVGQVYLDDATGEPTWATVSTGLFGTAETFVSLRDARSDGDDLHVTHDKDTIKHAPRVDVDQHLSGTEEADLYRHYGLERGAGRVKAPAVDAAEETPGTGRVRLRRYTTDSETETVDVPVTKEKLVVERNPVGVVPSEKGTAVR